MTKTIVNPGACGFEINLMLEKNDDELVKLSITTDCITLKNLEGEAIMLDPIKECYSPLCEGTILEKIKPFLSHTSCPVISGILKSLEVESRLSMPHEASIIITRE